MDDLTTENSSPLKERKEEKVEGGFLSTTKALVDVSGRQSSLIPTCNAQHTNIC